MFIQSSEDVIVLPASPALREVPFPAEVEMILSAMEAGREAHRRERLSQDLSSDALRDGFHFGEDRQSDRRSSQRMPYRVRAELRLFSDRPGSPAWLLYVRDADRRGLGFITPHRLPLGYGGSVDLLAASGRPLSVPCVLSRCREAVQGWYEGALTFNREQCDFD